MCPMCLATMGLYVAGGVSAGSITTYLATRLLRGRRDQLESIKPAGRTVHEVDDRSTQQEGRER